MLSGIIFRFLYFSWGGVEVEIWYLGWRSGFFIMLGWDGEGKWLLCKVEEGSLAFIIVSRGLVLFCSGSGLVVVCLGV